MHGSAFEHANARSESKTDQVSDDHNAIEHQKGDHELAQRHGMFFDGGHFLVPYQKKADREAQKIERQHGHGQKDREVFLPLRENRERQRLCTDL